MQEVSAPHPTAKHLTDFVQGRLTPAQAESISKHLETCPDCIQAVEKIPADSFADLVRSARPSGTHIPGGKLVDVPPAPPGLDVPPELVNHPKFRLEKELGRGGMGVVYKAKNLKLGNTVALKVITRGLSSNPEALKRFQQEVHAAGKLDRPNIVKALDADQAGDLHLLVMDFVDGLDLTEVLQKKGPLPVLYACEYIRQAALGLQHAHEQGMIHRDIKPKNLMLTRKGQVKILDFGLAGMTGDKSDSTKLTKLGSFMGTVEYMAPEQAEDATKADIRSDIYSLGCTLYCLLTGQPPFVRETDVKIILAHLGEEATPLHQVRSDVPKKLSALVAKMLAKEPAQRYQTPVEVVQALREFCKPGMKPANAAPLPTPVRTSEKGTVAAGDRSRNTTMKPPTSAARPTGVIASEKSPFQDLEVGSEKSKGMKPPQSLSTSPGILQGKGKWLIGGGIGLVVLLLVGVVGLWAASMIFVKTQHGTIVVENVPGDAEVIIDGKKVTVSRNGQVVTIEAVTVGPHNLRVLQGEVEMLSSDITVKIEGEPIRVRLDPKVPDDKAFVSKTTGMKFVLIKPGTFLMGSLESEKDRNNDEQQHEVEITRPFFFGMYEVTRGQFQKFIEETGYETDAESDDIGGGGWDKTTNEGTRSKEYSWRKVGFEQTDEHPVINVTWNDTQRFCAWLSKKDGQTYRLPTEAEWEYACRAGTQSRYYFGDDEEKAADYENVADDRFRQKTAKTYGIKANDGNAFTSPVGSYKCNPWGLFDMHGNVYEWCSDWYGTYAPGKVTDPTGPQEGPGRVLRGGSWGYNNTDFRASLRARDDLAGGRRGGLLGFRLAKELPSVKP